MTQRLAENRARDLMQIAIARAGASPVGEVADAGEVRLLAARGEHVVDLRATRPLVGAPKWRLSAMRSGAAAELSLRPELAGEALDKLFGMTLDLETGDRRFDRRFVVEAAPAAVARHLLDVELRGALMALPASDAGPTLRVDGATLTVAWEGDVTAEVLAAVLHGVYGCLDRCRALHEALAAGGDAPFRASSGGSAAVDPASRADARARIGRARRKAAAFVATAGMVGVAFLATVVTGGR